MKVIVQNGGFENKSTANNDPNGWFATRVPQTAEHVLFDRDSEIVHSGSYSVSIEIKDSHPEDTIAYNWMHSIEKFEIGKAYQLNGWIKTKDLKKTCVYCCSILGQSKKRNADICHNSAKLSVNRYNRLDIS
ncbi:MAG: hypothetical protein J7K40_06930 [candidate division Zixibacteria bacterium]|nr:hypothetical protein [candidate division Zixibacteria bacterium]